MVEDSRCDGCDIHRFAPHAVPLTVIARAASSPFRNRGPIKFRFVLQWLHQQILSTLFGVDAIVGHLLQFVGVDGGDGVTVIEFASGVQSGGFI